MAVVCLSVCLSVRARPKSKTKRHSKLKFGRNEASNTGDPWPHSEIERSEVKVTRSINAVTENHPHLGNEKSNDFKLGTRWSMMTLEYDHRHAPWPATWKLLVAVSVQVTTCRGGEWRHIVAATQLVEVSRCVKWDVDFGVWTAVEQRGSAGHRIDAICSQLITSRQHHTGSSCCPQPSPCTTTNSSSLYDAAAAVVKKEVDDTDSWTVAETCRDSADCYTDHHAHHHHHEYHHHTERHHSPRSADTAAAADREKMFFSTRHSPPQSALAALTDW